jgi:hypothetical protein
MATRFTEGLADNQESTRTKRVLVIANEALGGNRLVEEISKRAGDAEVLIVSPALVASPLDLAAGDVDDAIEEARRRLQVSVDALQQKGIQAAGEVGEAQPDLAMRDAMVKFPADEVIIVARPQEYATWLEQDLLDRARRELAIPITYIEVEPRGPAAGVREVTDVRPAGRRVAAEQRAEEFDTDYLPPMPTRDRLALALGPLGTVALWLLASDCQGELAHDATGDAGCIAVTLLAIFGLIITAIHVPVLLLLRSGRYTSKGLADFMSLAMFVYFPPALLAAVVIAVTA